MITVLLVIHILIALALIVVVLLQRSEGGGLGVGSSGGMGGFMTARGTANLLTRTTAILAAAFMSMSLLLAILSNGPRDQRKTIFDDPSPLNSGAPVQPAQPAAPAEPAAPAQPAAPSAPVAR
jgi:preprotein translocase subunit SecG